ncbi:hypothetical protein WJX73_005466 [Symbiochloris irregularis]|uniref:Oxidoreductase putative C-terminal domain-containing protein n=1 Tax=Symbiochloris irregularis TaxID=706552 RepID=A0AAW1P371_9CHLO
MAGTALARAGQRLARHFRLDKLRGIEFTAIVDPNTELAHAKVAEYSQGPNGHKWKNAEVFKNYASMLESQNHKPDAAFIGLPPEHHGSIDDPGSDIEVKLAEAGIQKNLIIAVGYMLRYNPAVEVTKRILAENDTPLACLIGRYTATYNHIRKRSWWDLDMSGGTIVEQATHFVDLMRYFGGEIVQDSILAAAVGPNYPLASMAPHPEGENLVPMDRRVNRVTSATFHFDRGAVGSLTHTCLMHEQNFFTTFELMADGMHLIIGDPYNTPTLKYRRKHSNEYEDVPLDTNKDMYVHQFEGFLEAVRTQDEKHIRCPYASASLTYQASQWITSVANKNRSPVDWSKQN